MTNIVHLSDIHIRYGNTELSRYDEYIYVFNEFNKKLEELKLKNLIIVIAGDIFHFKNRYDGNSAFLFKYLIDICAKYAIKTLIIPGNHDIVQEDITCHSIIDSIVIDNDKILILNKTSNFVINEIGFSTIDIRDTLDMGNTCGIKKILPKINSTFDQFVKYKVVLFHGSFRNCKLNKDKDVDNNYAYPFEWVQEFDLALLGDIHMRQIGKFKNTYWGYPSSLVQCSFGEDPFKHGFVVWDIESEISYKCFDLYNPYARLNIKYVDDKWLLSTDNGLIEMIDAINHSQFPTKPTLKIINKNNLGNIEELYKILENIEYNIITITSDVKDTINEEHVETDINDINDKNNWIEYFNKNYSKDASIIRKWILEPNTLMITIPNEYQTESLNKKITEKNKILHTFIEKYMKSSDIDIQFKPNYKLVNIEWSHLLCYGKGNKFNFESSNNSIVLINGRNGIGKSAFFEIICYAIFGETMESRSDKSFASAFINKYKPLQEKSETIIIINVKDINYTIKRTFDIRKNSNSSINQTDSYIYEDNSKKPIRKNITAVNNWIHENIGTIDNFLFSSMITQNNDTNLFDKKPKEQLSYVDKFLRIDSINNFIELIHKAELNYKYICDCVILVHSHMSENITLINKEEVDDLYNKRNELAKKINIIKEKLNQINYDPIEFTNEILEQDIKSKINELNEFDIDKLEHYKQQYNEESIALKNIKYTELSDKYYNNIQIDYNKLISQDNIKPHLDEEHIKKEMNKRTNLNVPKYTKIELNDHIIKEQSIINDLYKNIPIQPEINLKNNIILIQKPEQTLNEINLIIIEQQKIVDESNNSKPSGQYKKEFLFSKNIIGITNADELLTLISNNMNYSKKIYNEKKYDIKQIYKDQQKYNNSLYNLQKEYESKIIEYNKLKDELKQYSFDKETIISKPQFEEEEITNWFENYNIYVKEVPKYKKLYDKLNEFINIYNEYNLKLNDIEQELINIEKQLEEYKNIECNEKCKVCMKQPWVILKIQLELKRSNINKEKILIKKHMGLNDINVQLNKFEKYKKWIDNYERFTIIKPTYETSQKQWIIYKPYIEMLDKIQSIKTNIVNIDIHTISININNTKLLIENVTNDYNNCISYANDIYNQYVFNKWYDIHHHHKLKLDEFNNIYKTIITYNENEKSKLYNKWSEKLENHKKILNDLTEQLSDVNLYELIEEYTILQNSWKKFNDTNSKIKVIEYIIKSYAFVNDIKYNLNNINNKIFLIKASLIKDKYIEKNKLTIELNELNTSYEIINNEYRTMHNTYIKMNQDNERNVIFKKNIDQLNNHYIILKKLKENISQFKDYIYNDIILANLLKKINHFISNNSCNKFNVIANIIDNGIYWYIQKQLDGKIYEIPYIKISGFEKFIVSLALRLNIAHFHNNTFKCNQLFIDEGFVSFDTYNLDKVPIMLENLLNKYDSIILVSHIEKLKENNYKMIEIKQNKGISYLQL
jgi:DNA repair exonuclease SbcCD ATPase subunit